MSRRRVSATRAVARQGTGAQLWPGRARWTDAVLDAMRAFPPGGAAPLGSLGRSGVPAGHFLSAEA